MIVLDLNLASRPIRNNTLVWTAHGLLLAALLGATAWNASAWIGARRELRDLRADKDSIDSRRAELVRREEGARQTVGKFDLEELELQAAKANDVIQRKALSWTRLFNLMEQVMPYEVRMISIRPVFEGPGRGGSGSDRLPPGAVPVSVEGTAQSLDAFFELERALIFDPHFDRVEPHRFNRTTGAEVLFDLRFLYFPDGEPSSAEGEAEAEAEAPAAAPGAQAVDGQALPEAEAGQTPPIEEELP